MVRYVMTELMSNQGIQLTERRTMVFLIRIVLTLLLIVPPAVVRAQEGAMDAAAAQTADALSKSKQTSIVVFDFVGPDCKMTALGERLADDFSRALSQSRRDLRVENRSRIAEVVSKGHYAPDVIDIPAFNGTLAYDMKVKAFVSATISLQGQVVNVLVKSTRVKDSSKIASLSFSLALTEELGALLGKTIADAPAPAYLDGDRWRGWFRKNSPRAHCVSGSSCRRLLQRSYRQKDSRHVICGSCGQREWGHSDLERVIRPSAVWTLTAAVIQAVRSWAIKVPTTGLDGKPIAVRQILKSASK